MSKLLTILILLEMTLILFLIGLFCYACIFLNTNVGICLLVFTLDATGLQFPLQLMINEYIEKHKRYQIVYMVDGGRNNEINTDKY